MKKSLILLVVVIALVIGGIWYGRANDEGGETITIGFILPLTGDFGALGEEVQRGAMLATADVRAKGADIVALYEDDGFEVQRSAGAANKLVSIDKVDVGMTMIVEEAQPITDIFNRANIPLLVLWDSNKIIQTAGEYVYSNGFSTERAGEDMADYAYRKLNLKHVGIVVHVNPWADIASASFIERFKQLGGMIVFDERLQVDTTDYRTTITKLKQANPDGVYFPLIPPHNARFLVQADQLGLKMPLMTGDPLTQDVIAEAGKSAEGVYFTNYFIDKTQAQTLIQKYKDRFSAEPMDVTLVSFGYDGIIKGVEAQRKGDGDIRRGLDILFGPARTAVRAEKIFRVSNGISVEIPQ